jgi:hypothetical protein
VKKVVALAHSGWRGTVKKIGAVMIKRMSDDYGSSPSDIVCAIGPSICRSCYEVSHDVAEEFRGAYSGDVYEKIIDVKDNGKFQLDLHLACYYNFLSAGVSKEHIAMPDICTCCNPELLFSHRASKGKRGNLAAVAMLKA